MLNEFYDVIVNTFNDGYYNYSFVINFKPGSSYDDLHPKKANEQFKKEFERYLKRRPGISCVCFPEISDTGKFHVHGLMFHKAESGDQAYESHQREIKLVRSYINRKFGWNGAQRIFSLTSEYVTSDLRFFKRDRKTSFSKVWKYITKDVDRFRFLRPWSHKLPSKRNPGDA